MYTKLISNLSKTIKTILKVFSNIFILHRPNYLKALIKYKFNIS